MLLFFADTDQHENVRQAVVWKRRGFNSVVKYMSAVYDWLTVWTLRHNKFLGLIVFSLSLYTYLVKIAMLY